LNINLFKGFFIVLCRFCTSINNLTLIQISELPLSTLTWTSKSLINREACLPPNIFKKSGIGKLCKLKGWDNVVYNKSIKPARKAGIIINKIFANFLRF